MRSVSRLTLPPTLGGVGVRTWGTIADWISFRTPSVDSPPDAAGVFSPLLQQNLRENRAVLSVFGRKVENANSKVNPSVFFCDM